VRVRTHHFGVVVAALITIPLFAAAWIAYRYLGSLEAFRPWLLLTSYGRLSSEQWTLSWQLGLVGSIGFGAFLLWAFEGLVLGVVSSELHGSASWAKPKDLSRAKLTQNWGVVIGRMAEGRNSLILRTNAPDYSNIFLSAPPRAGKGAGVIIPTLLEYPGSFIVYDVKGENYDHTARQRLAMGDRVRVFSPFSLTLESGHALEGRSHGFNPLIPIAANPDLEDRITEIDLMASSLLSTSNKKEEGLLSSGREIFKAVCAIVCDEEDIPSLGKVVDLLSPKAPKPGEVADLQTHFAMLAGRAPDPLSAQALNAASANKNENNALYLSVLFDCGLRAWRNPAIRRATEVHDFDLDHLRAFPYAIYIIIPTPFKETAAPVVRLFFQLALRTLQKRIPDKRTEPLDVLFMIDEFHSLGAMKEVLAAPTVLPGFGGRIVTVVQTPASLDEIYGRDAARIFLDVTQLKIFMTPNDNTTKRMIEETLGYRTMVSKSVNSKSLGARDPRSQSYSEIKRPLMSADDIGTMPSDKQVVTIQGRKPAYADRIRYFEDPYFKAIHDAQDGMPWPTGNIPVVKDTIVTRADDFLAMPGGDGSLVAFEPFGSADETTAIPPDEGAGQGGVSARQPLSGSSLSVLLEEVRDTGAGEELGDALMAQMRAKMDAAFVASQSDFGVIAALERDVTGGAEDTPLLGRMRGLSPAEMARRVTAMPEGAFVGRPDFGVLREMFSGQMSPEVKLTPRMNE